MTNLIETIDMTLSFNDNTVRVFGTLEDPLFVVKDICDILGLTNTTETLKIIDEDLVSSVELKTKNSHATQNMKVVKEPGLYQIIMRCRKEIAKPFQRWVCGEVLPSLRKKGEYKMNEEYQLKLKQVEEEKLRIENEKNILEENYKKTKSDVEKLNTLLHKRNEPKVITEEKFIVYLLTANINGRTLYVIGKTADINKRWVQYKLKGILIPEEDIKLVYYKSCRCAAILNQVESSVILKMSKYIVEGTREVFETKEMTEEEMVNKFKEVIDNLVNFFEDVSPNITIENKDKKEDNRIKTELYVEENREEINEKVREDRAENPEPYRERDKKRDPEKKKAKDKRYYENHKEEILEKQKEYAQRPEVAEKIAVRAKKYFDQNKEERLEYLKDYRKNNKEEIKVQKQQEIKCLVCEKILTQQCWKRHTKSSFHVEAMKEGVVEEFEIVN